MYKSSRRKVFDRQSGGDIKLSDEQIEKIRNIATGKFPSATFNPYEPFLDISSAQKEIHPIDNRLVFNYKINSNCSDQNRKLGLFHLKMKLEWSEE